MKRILLLLMLLCLTIVWGQHTSGRYKPFLHQYGLKGKVKTLIEYNEYNFVKYHFNKKGHLITYQFYNIEGDKKQEIAFKYDDKDRLKSIISNNTTSIFTYLPNNVVEEKVSTQIQGISGKETYFYTYDDKGNLLSKERVLAGKYDGINYKELFEYDSAGRLLVKKYDLAYMKNRKESFGGKYVEKSGMETYEYSSKGQLKKHTQYDSDGKLENVKLYKEGSLTEEYKYFRGELNEKYLFTYTPKQIEEKIWSKDKLVGLRVYKITFDQQGNTILKTAYYESIPKKGNEEKTTKIIEKREIEYYPQ